MSKPNQDMRAPILKYDHKLSDTNTFRVLVFGPAWAKIEALIKMTHPPYQDELVLAFRDREEQRAAFLQQHPELAVPHGKGKK